MTETIRNKLAQFITQTHYPILPHRVVHQSKRCLLDFLGVALASGTTTLIDGVMNMFAQTGGKGGAVLIGEDFSATAPNAAFINGIKGHTLDMDDGNRFGNVHPAVVVFPAALALAEGLKTRGDDLIASIAAGYETLIGLAKSINPAQLQRGFHTTANLGAFGAAAACSKILGLNREQTANALSIAGLCGGGLLEVLTSGQMMKPFQTARAAQAGLLAAQLAARGALGPELAFEGEKGFFKAYSGHCPAAEDFESLGKDWEILNTYFKTYSACRHIHPALDAAAEIFAVHGPKPEEIAGIEIETYSIANALTGRRTMERSPIAAKFSMPVSVALMLVYGRLDKSQYTECKISNPLVQSLADKVAITVDPASDARYPQQRGARVVIKTTEQEFIQDVPTPKGEPENPLDDDELVEKFRGNAGVVLPEEKVGEIQATVLDLEEATTEQLMKLLAK